MEINISQKITLAPEIKSYSLANLSRSTVTLSVTTNDIGFIYWNAADMHITPPNFTEVSKRLITEKNKYSNPIYGVSYVKQTPFSIVFTISGLSAGKDYELFAYFMNLNQISTVNYSKLYFQTGRI